MKATEYHVTIDGYVCQGNSASGECLGIYAAASPKAACRKALKENGYDMSYWESASCAWWGCKVRATPVRKTCILDSKEKKDETARTAGQ